MAASSIKVGPEEIKRLRALITDFSGLDVSAQAESSLEKAVGRRLAAHGLDGLGSYWPLLESEPVAVANGGRNLGPDPLRRPERLPATSGSGELRHLVQLLTNKETFFFREMSQFEVLRQIVLPELCDPQLAAPALPDSVVRIPRTGGPIRVWSAGCATGQEAYSLAITLLQTGVEGRVLATDIDTEALEVARRGCYEERSMRLVSDELRQRYFDYDPAQQCYRVRPVVAQRVDFRLHNLARDSCPDGVSTWDVIFCRNVTIYFEAQARERLNAQLSGCLREGGYLFVASAETMSHNQGRLELVPLRDVFVFRKGAGSAGSGIGQSGSRAPQVPFGEGAEGRELGRRELGNREPGPAPVPIGDLTALSGRPGRNAVRRSTIPGSAIPRSTNHESTIPEPEAMQAAVHAFKEQAYEAALAEIGRLPAEAFTKKEVLCLRAAILLQQAHLDEAQAICRQILADHPWHADAYLILGLVYRQRAEAEASLEAFRQAIYLQPSHRDAHFFLAETYRSLGLWSEAEREYENTLNTLRAGRRRPGAVEVHLTGLEDEMLARACQQNLDRLRKARPRGGKRA